MIEVSIYDEKHKKNRHVRFLSQDIFEIESKTTERIYYEVSISSNTRKCPGYYWKKRYGGSCDHLDFIYRKLNEVLVKIGQENKTANDKDILDYVEQLKVVDYDILITKFPESIIKSLIRNFELLHDRGKVRRL